MSSGKPRDDILAKYLFFSGLAFLPWLWVVNVMYFWNVLFGHSLPFCSGQDTNGEGNGEIGGVGGMGLFHDDEDEHSEDEDNGNENESPSPEEVRANLTKWVKRSATGSAISMACLLSWNLTFQLNKDSFGYRWFVMSQDDEEKTGW